jgi:predicted type IV restriction endonuclease
MDKEILKELLADKISEFESKNHNKESERDICRAYIEPLFEYLGWHMRDTDEVKEQKNQPQGRPDYIFYLNGSIAFFLETKKVLSGGITEDDIKQALNYARNNNKRWAVVSNFEELIILICDTKESSLLKHIFKRISYDNFVENLDSLLLLSRESFEKGLIDKEAEKDGRTKKTIKIDEELLNDILIWRKKLIESIKANNKTDYSKNIDEITQTLLNRIIFIRTVEDRKHEAYPDETIKSILNQYEANKGISIKDKINNLFEEYDKIYDSKLFTYDEGDFKIRHECEKVNIDNNTYYKILKETYDKNEIYSYKFNEIDADVLGSMYEKYIGNIQEIKKNQGIYYTPTYIVDYIVNNSINLALNHKKLRKNQKLKILDMACGSGSFLLKAFDVLDWHYRSRNKSYSQSGLDISAERAIITQKTTILKEHIFGVDLDIKAVEIAQLNLLLKIADTRHRLPDLRSNIKWGNSLIDNKEYAENTAFNWNDEFKEKFEIIVGNPPYIMVTSLENNDKQFFLKEYKTAFEQYNIYYLFYEKAIRLLENAGVIGFITPIGFLNNKSGIALRKFILDTCKIINITDASHLKIFKDASTYPIIFIAQKETNEKIRNSNIIEISKFVDANTIHSQFKIKQKDIMDKSDYSMLIDSSPETSKILNKIEEKAVKLGAITINYRGMQINKIKFLEKEEKQESKDDFVFKAIHLRDVKKWLSAKPSRLIVHNDKKAGSQKRILFNNNKILIPRFFLDFQATYSDKTEYILDNIYIIQINKEGISLKYVLAILNSELMNFYYRYRYSQTHIGGGYYAINGKQLDNLPIKIIEQSRQKPIVDLVDRVLEIKEKLNLLEKINTDEKRRLDDKLNELQNQINKEVYLIYGFKEQSEIEMIRKGI